MIAVFIHTFRCGRAFTNRWTRHSWTLKRIYLLLVVYIQEDVVFLKQRDNQLLQSPIKFRLNKIFVKFWYHHNGQADCCLASVILYRICATDNSDLYNLIGKSIYCISFSNYSGRILELWLLHSGILSNFHSRWRVVCYTNVLQKQVPTIAQKRNIFVLTYEENFNMLYIFFFVWSLFFFIKSMQASWYYSYRPFILDIRFS